MPLGLEITLGYIAIPATTAWRLLQASHPSLLGTTKQVDFYGQLRLASDMADAIQQSGKPHFVATIAEGRLTYMPVGGKNLQLAIVETCVGGAADAWMWLEPFAHSNAFRSARLYDQEYEYWQNAYDPLQYTAVGRSYAGLPMKSNGLPFPLEQMIVDTSRNPGRRIFREGYVEGVGSVMWLGQQFWTLTGASEQSVLAADWLRCRQLSQGVLRVQAADEPFATSESASAELQDRLRLLLFPQRR